MVADFRCRLQLETSKRRSAFDCKNATALGAHPSASKAWPRERISAQGRRHMFFPGQLIMLTNANSSCILTATEVNAAADVITFNYNDPNGEDALGLNQFPGGPTNPSQGIGQLQTPGTARHLSPDDCVSDHHGFLLPECHNTPKSAEAGGRALFNK
jgi:hypothetical protein